MAHWNRTRSLLAVLMAMTCLAVSAGCGTLTVYTYPGDAPRLVLFTATTTCLAP